MSQSVHYICQPMLYQDNKNWYGIEKLDGKVLSKKSLRTTDKEQAKQWVTARRKAVQSGSLKAVIDLSQDIWLDKDTPYFLFSDPKSLSIFNQLSQHVYVVSTPEGFGFAISGDHELQCCSSQTSEIKLEIILAPQSFSHLGDPTFITTHKTKFCYVTGAMANGIGSCEVVEMIAKCGGLGFFGSAGLPVEKVVAAIDRLKVNLVAMPFGMNLIHSPAEPELEASLVDLYLEKKVHLIEAAAFLSVTMNLVKFRVAGIYQDHHGNVITPNNIFAKLSREELAEKFLAPPPEQMIIALVADGFITEQQGVLARTIPMAQDITAEADSGGHTDNRAALALLPTFLALRDKAQAKYGYASPLRIGLAGGIATGHSAAAAFAMGASYIVTGSVNQSCVESGSSDVVREMLSQTRQADVAMAPAADMFEMGVEVQVLKRGTMFAMRGQKLYEIYRQYKAIEDIPLDQREKLEKTVFKQTFDDVWRATRSYFLARKPEEVTRAEEDPHHKMALIFRSYLGQASMWANSGLSDRRIDFQIWCGPAMGAFNEWASGSFLAQPHERHIDVVAMNILYGVAKLNRINAVRCSGITLPAALTELRPLTINEINERQL